MFLTVLEIEDAREGHKYRAFLELFLTVHVNGLPRLFTESICFISFDSAY